MLEESQAGSYCPNFIYFHGLLTTLVYALPPPRHNEVATAALIFGRDVLRFFASQQPKSFGWSLFPDEVELLDRVRRSSLAEIAQES
jgi:hypothetical protein